mgnify:CR=1 FL=1
MTNNTLLPILNVMLNIMLGIKEESVACLPIMNTLTLNIYETRYTLILLKEVPWTNTHWNGVKNIPVIKAQMAIKPVSTVLMWQCTKRTEVIKNISSVKWNCQLYTNQNPSPYKELGLRRKTGMSPWIQNFSPPFLWRSDFQLFEIVLSSHECSRSKCVKQCLSGTMFLVYKYTTIPWFVQIHLWKWRR